MIRQFAKISWAQRGVYVAMVAALSTGAFVFAMMMLVGSALDSAQGDRVSLGMIGVIAAICTVVVLDAITRHGISERWPSLRRLRIIGLGSWSLRGYLAVETVLLALAASVVGYAAALAFTPALVPYLSTMGVVPVGLDPRPELLTAVQVTTATSAVGLVATAGAARRAARREPVSVGLIAEQAPITRRLGAAFTFILAVLTGVSVWQALTAVNTQAGFLWGLLATVSTLGLLSRNWRNLAAQVARVMIVVRPGMSAPALVSARWTSAASKATTSTAVMLAIGLCVFFVGHPAITEQAAKDRLSQMLAGTTVLTHPTTGAGATTVDPDGTGIVLTQTEVATEEAGYREPAQLLTGSDAEDFLGPYLEEEASLEGPGVVVTASRAADTGLRAGQTMTVQRTSDPITLPIIAIAAVPGTLGDLYLIGDTILPTGTTSGPTTLITTSPASSAPPGWLSQSAEQWIADLPPGAAVSATGGQGTAEAPLLIGAPIALALALAMSSTAITTLARREDITQLGRIGMARTSVLCAVARQAIATTVPPAFVALGLSGLIVLAAAAPFTTAISSPPAGIGPVSTYVLLAAALVLSVFIVATATARPALYRPT